MRARIKEVIKMLEEKEKIEMSPFWCSARTWCCPVDSSKAKAKYDSGLLTIEAPLQLGPTPKEVKIELEKNIKHSYIHW